MLLPSEEQYNLKLKNVHEKVTFLMMDKTFDLKSEFVFKRIIYFNFNYRDLIVKTVKVIKDELMTANSRNALECSVCTDSIVINCNYECAIKEFERFLIYKLPSNVLIYPHYTVNSVNFEDIRRFQVHKNVPLGQCIVQAIQVSILFY